MWAERGDMTTLTLGGTLAPKISPILPGSLDVPAVNPHGSWTVWGGKFTPIAGTALNKRPRLLTQLLLQALCQGTDVMPNRDGLQGRRATRLVTASP